jgi:hypothetical protein
MSPFLVFFCPRAGSPIAINLGDTHHDSTAKTFNQPSLCGDN